MAKMLHEKHPGVRLMVDNCYGEFVCEKEPSHYGADVCVGSLIKNPGGGLAPTGGYIVGTKEAGDRAGHRAGSWVVCRKLPAVLSGLVHGAAHRCAGD